MQNASIKRVEIRGLHNHNDIGVELSRGLNIIYGKNGSGKTTFLHVLANLAETDIERFCFLRFEEIVVVTEADRRVTLRQERPGDEPRVTVEIDGRLVASVQRGAPHSDFHGQLAEVFGGRPVYLPAFRAILEAISSGRARHQISIDQHKDAEVHRILDVEMKRERTDTSETSPRWTYLQREAAQNAAYKTVMCREWFGAFVPVVRFPSLPEVAEQLGEELQSAQIELAGTDRQAFSEVFVKVLQSVLGGSKVVESGSVEALLSSIRESLAGLQTARGQTPQVYYDISNLVRDRLEQPTQREAAVTKILRVYDEALRERVRAQERAFERIRNFEESVNRFLQGKRLNVANLGSAPVRHRGQRAPVITLQGGRSTGLSVLSSGERHVLTILFSATHMSTAEGMLLIDEPELSLHVDWQRIILGELMKQAGNRQIIACTHAPEVTADHRDQMRRLASQRLVQSRLFEDDSAEHDGYDKGE